MWEGVELRELRVFLTLADELHFGRTAERLHVTPSRVSQTLRGLESKLGGRLVHRTSRRVALTPLGERFRSEAGSAYEQLVGVLERTHAANSGLEGTLRIGLLSGPAAGPHLARIIGAFERRHPDCSVQVSDPPFGRQFELLRSGEVELMATWLPHGQRDLVAGPTLTREPRVLAVAPDHPLAARAEVSLEDVADYRVASVDHFFPRELAETLIPPKAPSGRPIRSVAAAPGQIEHALMIARGEIVHPTVASVIGFWGGSPEIVCVPLSGLPELRSVLVWRRGSGDPRARAFVRVARELLGEE